MRRILRTIAEGGYEHLGDVSTLANPRVVKDSSTTESIASSAKIASRRFVRSG